MPTQELVSNQLPRTSTAAARTAVWSSTESVFALALLSSLLLWLCFFPANWGWLAWVALTPLLSLVRSAARPSSIYWAAWVGGLLFFWPVLQWMRVADPRMYFTWALLATYCAAYFPLAIFLLRRVDQRTHWPLTLTAPMVWIALEYLRSFLAGGFAWYLMAHTQHDFLALIQVADITGAWGVGFLLVAVNGFLCELLCTFGDRPQFSFRPLLVQGAALVGAAGLFLAYSQIPKPPREPDAPVTKVALVQGNLPQYIRNNPTTAQSVFDHYVALTDVAAHQKPDLIVWPETSLPTWWEERWPAGPTSETVQDFAELGMRFHTATLLGLNSVTHEADLKERRYNSALLLSAQGTGVARYDKIHLVPFGEYVPLRHAIPLMNLLSPYDFDYSLTAGTAAARFPLSKKEKGATFGVLICYEDTDADLARPYAGGDGRPPVDFLLNISNDGWFDGTTEHEQHLAICRFRAIETRRVIGRAANVGISAIIDPSGRVLTPREKGTVEIPSGIDQGKTKASIWMVNGESPALPCGQWGQFKKVAGVILADVGPAATSSTYYARFGDWLPWLCWGLLLWSLFRRPRQVISTN